MKNLFMICLVLNTAASVSYANDFASTELAASTQAAVEVENERVQLLLRSYAEIVSLYQDQIDADNLDYLSAQAAALEVHINAQLNASAEEHLQSITQHFTFNFSQ